MLTEEKWDNLSRCTTYYKSRYMRGQPNLFHYTIFQVSMYVIYSKNIDIYAWYKGRRNSLDSFVEGTFKERLSESETLQSLGSLLLTPSPFQPERIPARN